jgi:hypothetical protein
VIAATLDEPRAINKEIHDLIRVAQRPERVESNFGAPIR